MLIRHSFLRNFNVISWDQRLLALCIKHYSVWYTYANFWLWGDVRFSWKCHFRVNLKDKEQNIKHADKLKVTIGWKQQWYLHKKMQSHTHKLVNLHKLFPLQEPGRQVPLTRDWKCIINKLQVLQWSQSLAKAIDWAEELHRSASSAERAHVYDDISAGNLADRRAAQLAASEQN